MLSVCLPSKLWAFKWSYFIAFPLQPQGEVRVPLGSWGCGPGVPWGQPKHRVGRSRGMEGMKKPSKFLPHCCLCACSWPQSHPGSQHPTRLTAARKELIFQEDAKTTRPGVFINLPLSCQFQANRLFFITEILTSWSSVANGLKPSLQSGCCIAWAPRQHSQLWGKTEGYSVAQSNSRKRRGVLWLNWTQGRGLGMATLRAFAITPLAWCTFPWGCIGALPLGSDAHIQPPLAPVLPEPHPSARQRSKAAAYV